MSQRTPLILAALAMTAVLATAVGLPAATAQSSQSQAPQLVSGLPDFTVLVDQVGPAVVNVESGGATRAGLPDQQDMPEFFRRFFGEGMPMPPGMPQPQDPGGRRGVSMGTGFIISADGYVLTNHHVVSGGSDVKVRLSDRREFTAKVVGSDEQSDVALLKLDASALPALRIGNSQTLKPGQWVVAIGSPFGLDHSVTAGIVSAVGRANPYANQRYVPFIQTDVAINRGNSGGPLLNTRGEVVGINSQIFSNSGGYMGVSFAIPIDVAMNAVQQLKTTGRVRRGQLGVQLQAITAEDARGLGLPDTRGALVNLVMEDGPADKAGIQRGDVIRAFNGTPVDVSSQLPPLVGALAPGSKVTLSLLRDGKTLQVPLVLSQLDEGQSQMAPRAAPPPRSAAGANPLGLVGEELDTATRTRLGLGAREGVAIARVEGMAARQAGLQSGDIVLAIGRDTVASPADLDRQLRALRAGQTVMLLVRRGDATQYIAVTPRIDGDR